jgi:hypothetical protein
MRKSLILILSFCFASLLAQPKVNDVGVIGVKYQNISMKGVKNIVGRYQKIYVVFPSPTKSFQEVYVDTVLPTKALIPEQSTNLKFACKGDVGISMYLTETGTEESDSLSAWIKPLVYDDNLATWTTSTNDSTFLVFDTPGTYTSTAADYLNYTKTKTYTTTLVGQLWPGPGFMLGLNRWGCGQAATIMTGRVAFWIIE